MPKHQKRRHRDSASDDEEKIRKKIKKLQGRLDRQAQRSHSPSFSVDRTEATSPMTDSMNRWLSTFSEDSFGEDFEDVTREQVNLEVENKKSTPGSSELDEDILAILGEKVASKVTLAPPFQKDVAATWTILLKNGLCEEERNDLIKKYPPSENCLLLGSPKLNPEVGAIINSSITRRDNRFVLYQNQMGAAISALGQLLTSILSEEKGDNITYIKLISDASRLFLDLHQKHTLTRRELISINLHTDVKDFLTNGPIDGWLFGDKLGDRLRASNELAETSLELKPRQKHVKANAQTTPQYRRPPYQNQQQASHGQPAYRGGQSNRGGRRSRGGRGYGGRASHSGHASYDGHANYGGERQRFNRAGYDQRRNDERQRNFRQDWREPQEETYSPSRSWEHYRSGDRSPSLDGRSSPWSQNSYRTRRSP